jgi:hypothetical protein
MLFSRCMLPHWEWMSKKRHYAGIGSRETPLEVCRKMTEIASKLSQFHYVLRSGGAPGADSAFEVGAKNKQIFLPWNGFNGKVENREEYLIPEKRLDLVEQFHPNPKALSKRGLDLMSRNSYQILGPELNDPVDFVLCWTKDGKFSGGTAQGLRIAKHYDIPIFNFYHGYSEFATFISFQLTLS